MSIDTTVHDSSGNIFEDMGMSNPGERLAKAELARVIRKLLKERGLNQREAAVLLEVAQPDISDLTRGKLARFSMERLERFLNALDMDVRIQVGPKPEGKARADVSVELVTSF